MRFRTGHHRYEIGWCISSESIVADAYDGLVIFTSTILPQLDMNIRRHS